MDEPLLEMHEITKYIYDSSGRPIRNSDVKILDSVSFDLRGGKSTFWWVKTERAKAR